MKVTIAKKDLAEAVAAARRATKKETSLPVLKRLLLTATEDRFSVLGYNLQQHAEVFREAKITEPGAAVPDADLFSEIVSSLPECEIKLALNPDNNGIDLYTTTGAEYFFAGMPSEDFLMPKSPDGVWESEPLNGDLFKSALERVVFAAAKPGTTDNVRHTGISLRLEDDYLELAATDTHRLAVTRIPCPTGQYRGRFILPADCPATMTPALSGTHPVTVLVSGKEAVFSTDELVVGTSLIDGAYTKYEKMVSQMQAETHLWAAEFDRATFASALARVRIMAKYQLMPHRILLEVAPGKIVLKAAAGEGKGGETMDGVTDIPATASVGLHGQHVADWLGAMKSERVRIALGSRCAVLSPIDDQSGIETIYLCVPVEEIETGGEPE